MKVLGCTQLPELWESGCQSKIRKVLECDLGYYLKVDIKEKDAKNCLRDVFSIIGENEVRLFGYLIYIIASTGALSFATSLLSELLNHNSEVILIGLVIDELDLDTPFDLSFCKIYTLTISEQLKRSEISLNLNTIRQINCSSNQARKISSLVDNDIKQLNAV